MLRRQPQNDYLTVTPTASSRSSKADDSSLDVWPITSRSNQAKPTRPSAEHRPVAEPRSRISDQRIPPYTFLKNGHTFSYASLFLFTLILYARPAEFYPSALTASMALLIGIATLAFYIPTQIALEGTLTARPREINLVLVFCLVGLLSVPLAINPQEAWTEFAGTFIRCIIIFIVMVNVVRTEARLKGLLFLAMATSVW